MSLVTLTLEELLTEGRGGGGGSVGQELLVTLTPEELLMEEKEEEGVVAWGGRSYLGNPALIVSIALSGYGPGSVDVTQEILFKRMSLGNVIQRMSLGDISQGMSPDVIHRMSWMMSRRDVTQETSLGGSDNKNIF